MRVSAEEIESKRTTAGGWTRKQLAEWGVKWPPKRGWKVALENGEDLNNPPQKILNAKWFASLPDC
jgi:hypothetical protein